MSLIVRLIILIMLMIPTVTITPIKINQKNFGVYDSTGDKIVILVLDESNKFDIFTKDINTGIETRITTDGQRKTAPVITGNFIAWKQRVAKSTLEEVVLFDLINSTKIILSDEPVLGTGRLNLTDKWLVWNNLGSKKEDFVCAYNLLTDTKFKIFKEGDSHFYNIVVINDTIYYTKREYRLENKSNEDIVCSYNLITKEESIICKEKSIKFYFTGKGDWLAWLDTRNGSFYDLYLYQISKGKEYLVDNPVNKPISLTMSDGYVVYSTFTGKSLGPLYELLLNSDLKPIVLLPENSFRTNLMLSNDIILWEEKTDLKKNSPKIYGILASGGIPFEISNSDKTQYLIMNKNNIVVWSENKTRYDRIEKVCKINVTK